MSVARAVRYPVQGVTLHRVAAGQRSQGDGQETSVTSSDAGHPKTPTSVSSHGATPVTKDKHPSVQTIATNNDTNDTPGPQRTTHTPGPQQRATDTPGPQQRATNTPGPQQRATNTPGPQQRATNTPGPQQRATDTPGPQQRATETPGPQQRATQKRAKLPGVEELAHRLNKVSVMASPDSSLLNTPLPQPHARVLLTPKVTPKEAVGGRGGGASGGGGGGGRKKEPKFVPYEPYRCCVRPIQKGKKKRRKKEEKEEVVEEEAREVDKEKMATLVRDFERERATWEAQVATLTTAAGDADRQLVEARRDKAALENQLKIQSQVNGELKKLLVASVGEDVQGRVAILTEDKARMATMIRRYSERVDRDFEERERMEIQCDVWRSKFLGSSMLVDELAGWKAALARQVEEAREAVHVLLEEHVLTRQHVLNMYRMNAQLRDAFDPMAARVSSAPLTSADLVTLAVDGDTLAETVRDRLLGDLGRAVGSGVKVDGLETETPGEKMAKQVLGRLVTGECRQCSTVSPGRASMLERYHPNTRTEHLTVNCCKHCNGDIKVV